MKLTCFKNVGAVAALVAVGSAHAEAPAGFPPLLKAGTGKLTLSAEALSALSASGSRVITPGVWPSVAGLPGAGSSNAAVYSQATGSVDFSVSTMTIENYFTLTALQSANSFVQLRRNTFEDDESIISRSIYLANFDLSLSNSTVYADLYAHNTTTGVFTSFGRQAIFQAVVPGVVGGTGGHIEGGAGGGFAASGSLTASLRMPTNVSNIMLDGLGISSDGSVANLWRQSSWGVVSFTATSVPEPSTYALFGIGLLAMGALTRGRAQAA